MSPVCLLPTRKTVRYGEAPGRERLRLVLILLLPVGHGLGRSQGWKEEGRKQAAGVFARTTGKRPKTKDDDEDDLGQQVSAYVGRSLTLAEPRLTSRRS
jgi:hypothetical protein